MNWCFQNQCERAAYHESGHIVFAYLCGYRCEGVQLERKTEKEMVLWSGHSYIDYGKDCFYVSKFIGGDADVAFFETLHPSEHAEAAAVAHRIAQVFLAGSLAEAIYANNGNTNINFPIDVEWLDLVRVEFLNYALTNLHCNHNAEEFITALFTQMLKKLQAPEVWYAIEHLGKLLRKTKKINGMQIEEVLEGLMLIPSFSTYRA
jgi:hypothetical protein